MSYLLSCISTKHSMLKKHWQQSSSTMASEQKTECPVTVLGSMQKPNEDQGGLVCLLDSNGQAVEQIRLPMPAGMAMADNGVLVASQETVYHVTPDLSLIQQDVVSLPAFNMLHSMARTKHGYLVASTGLDAILEFTLEGELLWSWWAMEHGFEHTPTGERRVVDKDADHRGVKYGTLAQTTHVNSAAELPDGRILASLFHQGMIISIDRASGSWQPVLEGLDHPHAIRILNEYYFTVADTARGRALMVRFEDGKGKIEVEADAQTNWLQDCVYDVQNDCWVLVDGKNSCVSVRTGLAGERLQTQFHLDPEWRLYEILPL